MTVLPIANMRSLLNTKPTRYCDSLDNTTGKPLWFVSLSVISVKQKYQKSLYGKILMSETRYYGKISEKLHGKILVTETRFYGKISEKFVW